MAKRVPAIHVVLTASYPLGSGLEGHKVAAEATDALAVSCRKIGFADIAASVRVGSMPSDLVGEAPPAAETVLPAPK